MTSTVAHFTPRNMDVHLNADFDDIRPYYDEEIPGMIKKLIHDQSLLRSIGMFTWPRLYDLYPAGIRFLLKNLLKFRYRNIFNRDQLQDLLGRYVAYVIRTTTAGLTVSGIEYLPQNEPCLFISNHRDIVLDSAFIVYTLRERGFQRPQLAVGDNLLQDGFAKDVMRMNRSFMVVRSAESARAQYKALIKTSRYIRHILEQGESVWIAQSQGRSKDGTDITDPAVLKMFMLAYRTEFRDFDTWLNQVNLIPVTLTYELDPCAPRKAHELYIRDSTGSYKKKEGEDISSIVAGIRGYKGRVHLAFSPRVTTDTNGQNASSVLQFPTDDHLAIHIDEIMDRATFQYPVFGEAKRLLEGGAGCQLEHGMVRTKFNEQVEQIEPHLKSYFLRQYANQLSTSNFSHTTMDSNT